MKNNNDNEIKRNIITLGKTDVGKTCILNRYFNKTFSSSTLMTIGMDCYTKKYIINSKNFKVNFYDTAGQEKYHSIVSNYLRNAHGIILVYDITTKDSFEIIDMWIQELNNINNTKNIILLGNKVDLNINRVISKEDGIKLSKKINCDFFEVSAASNENINEAIEKIVYMTCENYLKENNKNNECIIVDMSNSKKNKCC